MGNLKPSQIVAIDFLIECVEELEDLVEHRTKMLKYSRDKNKRYREAINFAIDYLKNSDIRQVQLIVTGLKSALEESE